MNNYDIAIIGAGPAGMSAAIYAARSGKSVAIFERTYAGGQMLTTESVENYPAAGKISGWDLSENMKKQAEATGATFIQAEVADIKIDSDAVTLITSAAEYKAGYVIMAMGTERAEATPPWKRRHILQGCATRCISYTAETYSAQAQAKLQNLTTATT